MPRKIIVDGYNVIRRDPTLRRFESRGLMHAREALITRLQNSLTFRNDNITIVFDGWDSGNETETVERLGKITIIYSRHGRKADDVIADLAKDGGRTGEILVITHDMEVRESVVTSGGSVAAFAKRPATPRRQSDDEEDNPTRSDKKGNPRKLPKRKRGQNPHDLKW